MRQEILDYIEKHQPKLEFDYRDQLSDEDCQTILDSDSGYNDVSEELLDRNIDCIYELEHAFMDEVRVLFDLSDMDKVNDELQQYICVDINLKALIQPVPVRVTLLSDYDCINSNFAEGGTYSYHESYFGAMVDALNLNPQVLKQVMIRRGVGTIGRWPNMKKRNGQEYVKYDEFLTEVENTSCGANLLTIIGMFDVSDWKQASITIPTGNHVGLFSRFYGGGSTFDMELLRPMTIDLSKTGKTQSEYWGICVDSQKSYSIKETYGVGTSFFGGNIEKG